MMSTFAGLNIAMRGMYSSQAATMVTTNNISNINSEGYSRQKVKQVSAGTAVVISGKAIIGGGSEVVSVDRVRDKALDSKYWLANSASGEWTIKSESLVEIEQVLGEPSDNGFSTVMNEFYSALETLSDNAGDNAARADVLQSANAVCAYLNDASARLEEIRANLNTSVSTLVNQINSYADQIANLNKQIRQASVAGASTNELEDKRTLLIDELSGLTGVSVNETDDGMVNISVNGDILVNGGNARQVECYEMADGMYGIRWVGTGEAFEPESGAIKGYLELRDGDGAGSGYKGVPYYISQLDKFARTFAAAFNEGVYADGNSYYSGHAGGYGYDGSTGIRFFTYDGHSSADFMAGGADLDARYANITAANISVSQDIQEDVNKIAASSTAGEAENNENIADLISLCEDPRLFNRGTPEDFMNSILSTLGTGSSFAQRASDNKSVAVKNLNDRRTSVSGVSTDEETANLVKYQQAYDSAATLVSVWNKIYETTINMVNS
jgi:flagellar hook-associated protein 1 FlgK